VTPDITLAEIKAELAARLGLAIGLTAIHTFLHRIGLRRKKDPESGRAGPPRCCQAPAQWGVWQHFMDPARFVFLNETGASTNMVRLY
jgi:hypothetical protein